MKIYGSLFSPFVRKARVLIEEKQIDCEFVVVDAWASDSPVPAWSPLGKVPVLEVESGQHLFDSTLIVHYLDHLEGEPLPPREGADYWRSQWWQALGNGLIDATVARVLETRRPVNMQIPEKLQREEARIARTLAAANDACNTTDFLVGTEFSLADLVLGVAVHYVDARFSHDWRSTLPALEAWHGQIVKRSSFERTAPPGLAIG
ncbi:MAG: glutathione S-transferase N-terminal domain-containing protein [Proteobacteria bacterium]|nr:glutathione S-transferase N-terminal domain-containing protein [Burkholderiales bacterium]